LMPLLPHFSKKGEKDRIYRLQFVRPKIKINGTTILVKRNWKKLLIDIVVL
jgi:hypothetical protein